MNYDIPDKYKGCDFCGWATRNDLRCSDGRTIRRDAFAHQDGAKVPLIWGHNHDDPEMVLGHGFLENRPEGVMFYGYFNNSRLAKHAREDVEHGDVTSLSIWANQLTQKAGDVLHGSIKEVSLVLAGANLGAQITYPVVAHGDDCETITDEAYITFGDDYGIYCAHSDDDSDAEEAVEETTDDKVEETSDDNTPETEVTEEENKDSEDVDESDDNLEHSDDKDEGEDEMDEDKTIKDVLDTMNPEQLKAVAYLVGQAAGDYDDADEDEVEHDNFGGDNMNFNAFDSGVARANYISHSDQEDIVEIAKKYGSFKDALTAYAEENELSHDDLKDVSGFNSYPADGNPAVIDALFPEYHNVGGNGAPEVVTDDNAWVKTVLGKVQRSPYSRVRTRQVDIREIEAIRAKGYPQKGKEKVLAGKYNIAKRETNPTTVYVKSALNNDDITDITDFSYVDFQYKIDRMMLEKELARAILIGDGRDAADSDKIDEQRIRPIWTDDDLFTIHKVLNISANSNGTNTAANFGEGYRYAQATEELILDAKIDYRGSGAMDMFCTQQYWNKMILAKDLNGRRIYSNKNELMTALDVNNVYTVPEFQNKTRTVNNKTYRLLAIIGNLNDYQLGSTKGGEIIHRTQFDIDFNQQKSLLETRCSGANTRIYSFIVIEEEVSNP